MKITDLIPSFNPIYFDNLNNLEKPSCFITDNNYQLLKIRGLDFTHIGLSHDTLIFIFFKTNIYSYDTSSSEVLLLGRNLTEPHKALLSLYQQNSQIIDEYLVHIESLEDQIFQRNITPSFIDSWFDFKKDLSRIDRYYQRNLTVLQSFIKFFENSQEFPAAEFNNLKSLADSIHKRVKSTVARLDTIYSYYLSIKNERLNKNIYLLTFISAIFLPLNLLVGFFGMNTNNLFFKNNDQGTFYVLILLAGILLFSITGLKLLRTLDKWLFRHIFSRSTIYRKMSAKITSMLNTDQ